MSWLYVLNEHGEPVPEPDVLVWARWFETHDTVIAQDQIGDVRVSTVFLGLDFNILGRVPILYETMIFGGEHDMYQQRYTNALDALIGHSAALALVGGLKTKKKRST